ncbi:MAG: ribosomal protection-like ABC-F family protein [Peptostreptococcaceae bacterium]
MIELELKGIEKYYGANLILKDVNLAVGKGERVAIVGKNGTGKSTIFNIIVKEENYENGDVLIRKDATIGYLKQIPRFINMKVNEVLNSAFEELNIIEKELRKLENIMESNREIEKVLSKYSQLQEKYETLGGYERDTKISKVCEGLSIDSKMLKKDFELLSGGEKTTIMLGKILIENPDILLLDEPTNHLDMKSIEWLENYLKEYKGSVIIISHDRYFLDRIVTKVIEIENLISKTYIGNYSNYVTQKEENIKLQAHYYNEQQKEIKRLEESIKQLKVFSRNGENENFVNRAKSMQKRLDKIDRLDSPTKESNINLKINESNRGANDVIVANKISKKINDKILLKDASFELRYGEKVGLVGKNGCGKSTFIDIILGKKQVDSGEIKVANNKSLGYLPQNIQFKNDEMSIIDWFRKDEYLTDATIRQYLAKFMFNKENVFKKVGSLSGGEKTRLVISKMLFDNVNLLILDEPTNHLDISSIEILEEAILNFKGTVLLVSHDRYFINKICDKIVELENFNFNTYLGNYDYYKLKKEEAKRNVGPISKTNKAEIKSKPKDSNKINMNKKSESCTKKLEEEIALIEQEINLIDKKLADLIDDYEKIEVLYTKKLELSKRLDILMEEWIV